MYVCVSVRVLAEEMTEHADVRTFKAGKDDVVQTVCREARIAHTHTQSQIFSLYQ